MEKSEIGEGFEVFLSDNGKPFGAVREVVMRGNPHFTVYVENSGDFKIPLSSVKAVHSQKVIVDPAKLDGRLLRAIAHAHDAEDPNI
jgi:hypothetical protein